MAASMGAGLVIGMAIGIGAGIGSGIGIGRSAELSELRKKIRAFLERRRIRLRPEEGEELTHDEFLEEVTPGVRG
jgi:hypothetical protein